MKASLTFLLLVTFVQLMAQADSSIQTGLPNQKPTPVFSPQLPDSTIIETNRAAGSLVIHQPDSLQLLIDGYKEQKRLQGYKIQLYSGRSRMEAVKVKSGFHSKYGESEQASILYQQPNFKIRIGNYRDRLSANKALEMIKVDFPSAFIVQDEIKIDYGDD